MNSGFLSSECKASANYGAALKRSTLRPKLFSLLLMFLEHQGQMLEKEELMRALWPDSIVEEQQPHSERQCLALGTQ